MKLQTLLIVEDNASFGRSLVAALEAQVPDVRLVASVAEARHVLGAFSPSALLLDVCLPDGGAIDVIAIAATKTPVPHILAMSSEAGPEQAFLLAQRGVRAYLQKPFPLAKLETTLAGLDELVDEVPAPLSHALGRESLPEIEERTRRALVNDALARGNGSINAASRILGVSRQTLQHILRRQRAS